MNKEQTQTEFEAVCFMHDKLILIDETPLFIHKRWGNKDDENTKEI